jgi:hypothetical protein
VVIGRGNQPLGEEIVASLAGTRLSCRLTRRMLAFAGDLYIVVNPQRRMIRPDPARSCYFLSHLDPDLVDEDLVTLLSRGLAVLTSSLAVIDALKRYRLPIEKIYYVADRRGGSGPMAFMGMDNLLPRALHGLGVLADEEFTAATQQLGLPAATIALCLPEHTERFDHLRRSLLPGAIIYPGLRHAVPWKGCAASYRFLARRALACGIIPLTVYEDDAEFDPNSGERLAAIRDYLDSLASNWDVFSGLITDLAENAVVSRVETWQGERFATVNSFVGLVFSIWNRRALEALVRYTVRGTDVMVDTIDRYMEQLGLVCITPEHPVVAHSARLSSTLWLDTNGEDPSAPARNGNLSPVIAASGERLRTKMRECVRRTASARNASSEQEHHA